MNATDARIEAERAFAEISTPSHVLPNVATAWQRDREARIRLNKPLIDHARALGADEDQDEIQEGNARPD